MKNLLRSRTVAVVAGATVLAGIGGIGAADAATGHLPWNTVGTHQIRNGSVRSIDYHNGSVRLQDLAPWVGRQVVKASRMQSAGQGPAGPPGAPGKDAGLSVNYTGEPTPVANIGGKFADNATAIGHFDLSPGTYVVNAEGFFESTEATSGQSQLELALRGSDGSDYGTCFTGETSPTKGRDASCTSTHAVTVKDATTVTLYAFGYQDDQSSKDSGSWTAVGTANAIQVG